MNYVGNDNRESFFPKLPTFINDYERDNPITSEKDGNDGIYL